MSYFCKSHVSRIKTHQAKTAFSGHCNEILICESHAGEIRRWCKYFRALIQPSFFLEVNLCECRGTFELSRMQALRLARRYAPLMQFRQSIRSYSSKTSQRRQRKPPISATYMYTGSLVSVLAGALFIETPFADAVQQVKKPVEPEEQDLVNWSGTHKVSTSRYFTPETLEELEAIVKHSHETKQKLRPVGSALSPNGLPFQSSGMVNMTNMDQLLSVNPETNRVRVQAGATVNQLVEALRRHNLTLPNFASITEQQMGGITQVGAHGSGALIPPLDEAVVGLKIVTPAAGVVELSIDDDDPSLFYLVRTSLGMVGVVAEVELQCVPAHRLLEKTIVMSRAEVAKRHKELMAANRHLRYMWIPHTDSVVVVTCNPYNGEKSEEPKFSESERMQDVRELLKNHDKCKLSHEQIQQLSFTTLRDELLALDPLNTEWVKKINAAEASFWKKSEGARVDWSDKILQFDCGGQQWVSEVAFPVATKTSADISYMNDLLELVDKEQIAAPAPIEQRWSAPSLSPMSPVGEKPDMPLAEMYSWVGIIMYLPDGGSEQQRQKITNAFRAYKNLCERKLWQEYRAVEHWAKIEMPKDEVEKALLQLRTYRKYPVQAFRAICSIFDPHEILRNELMDTILGIEGSTM